MNYLRNRLFLSPDGDQGGGSGGRKDNSGDNDGNNSHALTEDRVHELINKAMAANTKAQVKKISEIVNEALTGEESPIMQRLNSLEQQTKKGSATNSDKTKNQNDSNLQGNEEYEALQKKIKDLETKYTKSEQERERIKSDQVNKARKETVVEKLRDMGFGKRAEAVYHHLQAQNKIKWEDDGSETGKPVTTGENDLDVPFFEFVKNDYAKSEEGKVFLEAGAIRDGSGSGSGERGSQANLNEVQQLVQAGDPEKMFEHFNKLAS